MRYDDFHKTSFNYHVVVESYLFVSAKVQAWRKEKLGTMVDGMLQKWLD